MTTSLRPAVADDRACDDAGQRETFVALLVAATLVPLSIGSVLWTSPGAADDPNRWVATTPSDIASLCVLVVWASMVRRAGPPGTHRARGLLWWAVVATAGLEVLALAVHPSARGFELLVRVAAAAAAADLVRRMTRERSRMVLLVAIATVGTVEALYGIAQSAMGRDLALDPFGFEGELFTYGSSSAGRGGFGHPYHLSCLVAVTIGAAVLGLHRSRRPLPWALVLGVCATCMATTFSRAGLIGLAATALVAAIGWVRHRDRSLWVVGALVVGIAVGVTCFGNGWSVRSETSTDGSAVDSGRRDRAREALHLVESSPVTGVGPGRYVIALEDVDHVELRPAHDLPLHVAAEAGIVAGLAVAAALALLARRCARLGIRCLCVFLPLVPFLLLDAYPYTWPGGLAMSGVWLGLLGAAWYRTPAETAAVSRPRAAPA